MCFSLGKSGSLCSALILECWVSISLACSAESIPIQEIVLRFSNFWFSSAFRWGSFGISHILKGTSVGFETSQRSSFIMAALQEHQNPCLFLCFLAVALSLGRAWSQLLTYTEN
jgi:hypothetical protein